MNTIHLKVSPKMSLDDFETENADFRGVYLVYARDEESDKYQLIYIGQSKDVSDRLDRNHNHYFDWLAEANFDEDNLRFSYAKPEKYTNLDVCEAALIFYFKPSVNTQCKDSFNHDDVEIVFTGRNVCGKEKIVVKRP